MLKELKAELVYIICLMHSSIDVLAVIRTTEISEKQEIMMLSKRKFSR